MISREADGGRTCPHDDAYGVTQGRSEAERGRGVVAGEGKSRALEHR